MARGKVVLIGAGPGSADLLTVRGLRALQRADVVLIDAILPEGFLEEAGVANRSRVIRHDSAKQGDANEQMAREAMAGNRVARLKCGDPLIFGRGLEEAAFLAERGIACEIIPGISSATSGPLAGGQALTARGGGRSFAVVTARCKGGGVNESFPQADTLVILMGVAAVGEIANRLADQGWSEETPVCCIERADQPWSRRVGATLKTLVSATQQAGLAAPAILLVGAGAGETHRMTHRPTVLFTGLDPTNFRGLGTLLHWPALRVIRDEAGAACVPEVMTHLEEHAFSHIIVTSRLGARSFLAALAEQGHDVRLLHGTTLVTTGEGTAQRLAEGGLRTDIVPDDPSSRGILSSLEGEPVRSVLLVQGTHAPGGLCDALVERGALVHPLSLHTIERHPELGRPLPEHDALYFVSPSAVRTWMDTYGPSGFSKPCWCMGEITQHQLTTLGVEAKVVNPYEHTPHETISTH